MTFDFKWLSIAFLIALSAPAMAGDLTISLTGVPDDQGRVIVSACAADQYLQGPCRPQIVMPAKTGEMTLIFEDFPAGRWGIQVLHDRNENGKLDFRWYGPPKEAYGNSNNPPPRMGPAKWDDIAFDSDGNDQTMAIRLRGGQ